MTEDVQRDVLHGRDLAHLLEDDLDMAHSLLDRDGPEDDGRRGAGNDFDLQDHVVRLPGVRESVLECCGLLLALGAHQVGLADQVPGAREHRVVVGGLRRCDRGFSLL